MEQAERLCLNVFGEPDQVVTRGHGHGVSGTVERFVRTGRGFPEGLIEAWANLYTEFAMATAAGKDGLAIPDNWLSLPSVEDGASGVDFIWAAVRSYNAGGIWQTI